MSAKKSPHTENSAVEDLIYEDVSLIGKYSVMEIALLAAGCRGDTRAERISDAVELLATVERYARVGSKARLHVRYLKEGETSSDAEKSVGIYTLLQTRFLKATEICHAAKRDKKTAKIELTSLVGLAYNATTGGKENSSEALRRYNEWAKVEASRTSISAEVFKAEYVSGARRVLVHNDHKAYVLGSLFIGYLEDSIGYLEDSPKRETKKIIQSKKAENKGQIVSRKGRGSDIAEGDEEGLSKKGNPRKRGQYKPRQVAAVDEH
jgi:hypothetical protein